VLLLYWKMGVVGPWLSQIQKIWRKCMLAFFFNYCSNPPPPPSIWMINKEGWSPCLSFLVRTLSEFTTSVRQEKVCMLLFLLFLILWWLVTHKADGV
jgi:hypothetical protein